jgi:hypothetical protein
MKTKKKLKKKTAAVAVAANNNKQINKNKPRLLPGHFYLSCNLLICLISLFCDGNENRSIEKIVDID